MLLSDSLATTICCNYENLSGVKVFCEKEIRNKVKIEFEKILSEKWSEALDDVEDDIGYCDRDDPIYKIENKDYGFLISYESMVIWYSGGNYYDPNRYGEDAFEMALDLLYSQYPSIKYECFEAYMLSDVHSGELVQNEYSSPNHKRNPEEPYDFVGEIIKRNIKNEDFVKTLWGEIEINEDCFETVKDLYVYKEYIGARKLEKILNELLEIASEIDEDAYGDISSAIGVFGETEEDDEEFDEEEDY